MIITATVSAQNNKEKAGYNGFENDRKVSVDFEVGDTIEDLLALYSKEAIRVAALKGIKLDVQDTERKLGNRQYDDNGELIPFDQPGSLLSDAQITEYFENEFKLSETIQMPKDPKAAAKGQLDKLTEAERREVLSAYGLK